MTIELHQHDVFQPFTEEAEPDLMYGDAKDWSSPRFFLRPKTDPALADREPLDYSKWKVADGVCPECFELIDGPECPHDWDAITEAAQWSSPVIHIDLRGERWLTSPSSTR